MERGTIVILNGVPRSGKSSIAQALVSLDPGAWVNVGVDDAMANHTPPHLLPGIGLRPGGERPELEDEVANGYRALYARVVAAALGGTNVVVDVGHHGGYTSRGDTLPIAAAGCRGFRTWLIGVRCPVDVIVERRRHAGSGYATYDTEGAIAAPVQLWQVAVHDGRTYDREYDTSTLRAGEIAATLAKIVASSAQPGALGAIDQQGRDGPATKTPR